MWMQNIPLHYVVNLFFWRFAVIFLPDFISNCGYTANLENHCIYYIRVELQRKFIFLTLCGDISPGLHF